MRYQTYKESGKVPAAGFVGFLFISFFVCFAIDAAYVYAMSFVGALFIRALLIVGAVAANGYFISFMQRAMKIRRRSVVRIGCLVVLAASFYASRCVYLHLVQQLWEIGAEEAFGFHENLLSLIVEWGRLFIHPGEVFAGLGGVLPYGVTSVNGQMLSGVVLLLLWIAEVLIFLLVPLKIVMDRSNCLYDEETGTWLNHEEEWPVTYVENYREVRALLRQKQVDSLLDVLDNLTYYEREGQESYAVIIFYQGRHHIGPYITLINMKAVQSGPKTLEYRPFVICRYFDVGQDVVDELRRTIIEQYDKRPEGKMSIREKRRLYRRFQKSSAKKGRFEFSASSSESLNEEGLSETDVSEEQTVHVPRVTPQMEKEYENRFNRRTKNHGKKD